jgi:chemotaxis protein methyltransferase CheR
MDCPGEIEYADVTALVAERSGMVFTRNRRVEVEAGVARAMRNAGVEDCAAYLDLIRRNRAELDHLVDELTVGETHFMRDPDQMDLLRREVLPALRQRRWSLPPRVWSAGCATGEEAYTLAILLEQEGLDRGAFVLGTDLSPVALEKARAGSYSDWSMRGVTAQFLQDYFHHVRKRRVLVDRIRSRVRFERLNLVAQEDYAAAGASGMDLILCRNVLIYFDHQTVGRIAARLYDSLAEGGMLLTAGADPLIGEYAPFEVDVTRAGLVYRRPRPAGLGGVPPKPFLAALPAPPRLEKLRPRAERTPPAPVEAASPPPTDPARQAFEQVLVVANGMGAFEAEVMAQAALSRHPLNAPLHYLRATLLLAQDRDAESEREARRALYLDPSLAVAHFLLGTILRKRGAHPGALRAFRNARDLSAARPADEDVPAGSGERMGALWSAASAEMQRLEVTGG